MLSDFALFLQYHRTHQIEFAGKKRGGYTYEEMELQITWDIVFVALFFVLFGVTLLRPHKFTLRLLLGTYISLLVAEGTTLFLENVILPSSPALQSLVGEQEMIVFMGLRIIFFTLAIVLFLVQGHYQIEHKKHDHWLVRLALHTLFAGLASLLLSLCFFAFLSGDTVVSVLLGNFFSTGWFTESFFVRPFLQTFGLWVVLPAVGMLFTNIFSPKD